MTKTDLHTLVDALPDESVDAAARLLVRIAESPLADLGPAELDRLEGLVETLEILNDKDFLDRLRVSLAEVERDEFIPLDSVAADLGR
jgi:nitrogen-specific signal transduction histidine kinase